VEENMKKRIIICSDGTWNSPEKKDDGRGCTTNVAKMAQAIRSHDPESNMPQIVFYDQGIDSNTFGWLEKKTRKMTGWGIKKAITDCYRFLVLNYERGDEIFLIGFSRGAYTVRSLAGLLDSVGLLAKTDLEQLTNAYDFYRAPENKRDASRFKMVTSLKLRTNKPEIQFLGAFDTVGALGIPTPMLGNMLKQRISFRNTTLPTPVKHAYQALAIDEKRAPFEPAIWTDKSTLSHVQQVWLAGTHNNIGGGHPEDTLSELSFQWMAQCAMECGLAFSEKSVSAMKELTPNPLGRLADSYSTGYKALNKTGLMQPHDRTIGRHLGVGEMIHESVLTRLLNDSSYRPNNLIVNETNLQNLLGEEHGHTTINVGGILMPVSVNRQQVRRFEYRDATLMLEGEAVKACEVIDLSQQGGAKLKLDTPPKAGTTGSLQSSKIGMKDFRVVWSDSNFAGVQFAAAS
jgi:hypothetical protein